MKKVLGGLGMVAGVAVAASVLAGHGGGSAGGPGPDWQLGVSGARGIVASCSWQVMQGASSHSGSEDVVTPATLDLGQATIVSALCQKKEDGTRPLVAALSRDGALMQTSTATNGYGIASVAGAGS